MRNERLGLVLIASSLVAIALISGLFVWSQREARLERNRSHGLSVARLLSTLPFERLAPEGAQQSALDVVRTSQANSDFAYAVLTGLDGGPLREAVAEGVLVPPAPIPGEPSAWIGERMIESDRGRAIREFHAPVLREGTRVAQLRFGFFEPGYGLTLAQASLIGMLALPVFLLAPLAYFLMRREFRPLSIARGQLHDAIATRDLHPVRVQAGGAIGDFVQSFNRFVEVVDSRAREVEGRETESLAAGKVVHYQKSRLEAVLETLPDAVLLLDEKGSVTFANGKLEALIGVSASDACGRRPAEWCDERELIAFLGNYEGNRRYRSDETEFSPGAMPQKRLAISARPLAGTGADAPTHGTLVLLRDVTAESLARRSQSEFVTHVAHELKSPLNVIAMYTEELLGKDGDREEFRIEACNVLQDEVERVSMLVSTLLSIARIETGAVALERQQVRLEDFLKDALETVSRGRRDDLSFELEVPKGLPSIHIDKELMRVAVNNLLTNAIKYNREGGEVALTVENAEDHLAIRVRDTGIGIAEKDRKRVFEKFFRSEEANVQSRAGHGLGLALAREIAELHGGRIQLESAPDVGSTFSIVLRKSPVLMKEAS